jgi:nucleoside-diphosphate-sugar epimerase
MKILLSGSCGYIGTVLGPMLLACGHDVIGLDSNPFRRSIFGNGMPEIPYIVKDICNVTYEDLKGFDAICHLAGPPNDPLGDIKSKLACSINHRASVRLAELALWAGVERFVFSSSCSIYGVAGDNILTEESPFNPITPYGKSKAMVEQNISMMADDKFSPVFLRISTAYGISPQHRFDLILNNMVAWAFTTGKITIKNDSSFWRPIVHVEDISRAFVVVLEAERKLVHNEAFNVGITSDNLRIRDIATIIGQMIPDCEILFTEEASADKRNYRVNCDKLPQRIPAFKPQWNIQKGVEELYRAYKEKCITLDDFWTI